MLDLLSVFGSWSIVISSRVSNSASEYSVVGRKSARLFNALSRWFGETIFSTGWGECPRTPYTSIHQKYSVVRYISDNLTVSYTLMIILLGLETSVVLTGFRAHKIPRGWCQVQDLGHLRWWSNTVGFTGSSFAYGRNL